MAESRPSVQKGRLSGSGGNNSPSWFVKPDFMNLLNEKFDEDALAELLIAEIYGEDGRPDGCENYNGEDALDYEEKPNEAGGD